ncbi:uncharacterized protein EDB93DRAFT_1122289 [Suillus bovinus]|uniref:uncharacterized protein n=1 Tax=Suillus bovinus TaxID=48563 RepID=UPI001B88290B|nr:uncharacterized protein EDB93DRAFT_1122289 [Suillus bovinus]KAG2157951.1 hypothetical protein EDB93DRAFT_1122289 [Suillus bovinus]
MTLVSFACTYILPISSTLLLHRIVPLSLCFPPLSASFISFIRSPLLHARRSYLISFGLVYVFRHGRCILLDG